MPELRRFAVLFDNLGPYHMGRLASLLGHGRVLALEASPRRSEYEWVKPALPQGIEYAPLELVEADAARPRRIEQEIERRLGDSLPDALAVPGWSSLAALVATRWAVERGIPVIVMSETNADDEPRKPRVEAVKRSVAAHFSGGLAGSRSQGAYLAALGVPREAIRLGYDVVDNAYFATRAEAVRSARTMPDLQGVQLPEGSRGRYFLGVNRFVEKKNLPALVRAYARFRHGRSAHPADWPLVLLGDGEERPRVEAEIVRLGLERHVHTPGFLQVEALPAFYATAGAFVHASTTEQWGLVVNEAMASGLPVAVSRRCGCVEELVEDRVTGLLFDPYDEDAIAGALSLSSNLPDRERLIARAYDRIARWDLDRFGRGLAEAAAVARSRRPVRPSLAARVGMALAIAQRRRQLSAQLRG